MIGLEVQDWDRVMSIRTPGARWMWAYLMKRMEDHQISTVDAKDLIQRGEMNRLTIWRALSSLEADNMLRRKGRHWDVVMINPQVVHPTWMEKSPDRMKKVIEDYHSGGMGI